MACHGHCHLCLRCLQSECLPITGVCLNGTLESTPVADFVDQMNVNFLGAVIMTKGMCLGSNSCSFHAVRRCIKLEIIDVSNNKTDALVERAVKAAHRLQHCRFSASARGSSQEGNEASAGECELLRGAHPPPQHACVHRVQICAGRLHRCHPPRLCRSGHSCRPSAPRYCSSW